VLTLFPIATQLFHAIRTRQQLGQKPLRDCVREIVIEMHHATTVADLVQHLPDPVIHPLLLSSVVWAWTAAAQSSVA
jgi:hypothetical protein